MGTSLFLVTPRIYSSTKGTKGWMKGGHFSFMSYIAWTHIQRENLTLTNILYFYWSCEIKSFNLKIRTKKTYNNVILRFFLMFIDRVPFLDLWCTISCGVVHLGKPKKLPSLLKRWAQFQESPFRSFPFQDYANASHCGFQISTVRFVFATDDGLLLFVAGS